MGLLLGTILATLLVSGCVATNDYDMPPAEKTVSKVVQKTLEPPQTPDVDMVPVKVYFGAHDGQQLEAEIHRLKNDVPLVQRAMEILTEGPRNNELWAVLPAAAKVKSVIVKERIAYVDFSDEMLKQGFGGSSQEILAVSAIVNTLTEFPAVERVQILVEGKKVSTLFGHMDVTEPLGRSPGIIKEK